MGMTSPQLLEIILAFIARSGMSRQYFGYLAVADSKLVARLEAGGDVTLSKAEQVLDFIKAREELLKERAAK
jgi:hypothetical protein